MRLWSLHPSLLDAKGLVALWREGLLAQKASLQGISTYLWAVHDKATRRGYAFDASKIALERRPLSLPVTQGHLAFERDHLIQKLRRRDPERFRVVSGTRQVTAHPLFVAVKGGIDPWERGR
jgi:hypothetical protein